MQLNKTALHLRLTLGLTQREAAKRLGITAVHLCNIEKGRALPSLDLIDKYREVWGVDLYVLAWCRSGEVVKLPEDLRRPARAMGDMWCTRLAQMGISEG